MEKINNIKYVREFKGYSQKYVAKKLGKSQPALSKIENGYTLLSDELIEQLSKILETEKEKLYSEGQTEKELPPLNNMATNLINQLSENKKLLHKVELNQQQLRGQLSTLLSVLTNKK
jgi:transcriptional regulator with XRE-family HTH domain